MKKFDKQPKVSIITPSFNQAKYLEQTIQSVLEQDYPNIEYILVDGASTDGSLDIIKKYADSFSYWVSENDDGQADAINKGFKQASGDIVAWLNSDDLYLPGTVSNAVAHLENNPENSMVYADVQSINALGEEINKMTYRQFDLKDLLGMEIIGQPSVFMRRGFLEKAGHLSHEYNFLLDHHLWLRMILQGPLLYVPEEWAAARFHQEAKNVALAEGFGREAFKILAWAKTQTGFAKTLKLFNKDILAGVYLFDAFYLLDGGAAWQALKAYWQVFIRKPLAALRQAPRILFAFMSLFGLGWLRKIIKRKYYRK